MNAKKITIKEIEAERAEWFKNNHTYQRIYWKDFNYNILLKIIYRLTQGRRGNITYNNVIIMADTETSKEGQNTTYKDVKNRIKYNNVPNYIVAWTVSIRAFNTNIVTLWGNNPEDLPSCFTKIIGHMKGTYTYIYFHNLAYDWVFIRRFMFDEFGYPESQLNVKPHYPIIIKWENGLILKDSLILAQRKLEKWANDLDVEHKKAVGLWDYNKIRHQNCTYTEDELTYMEHDTLAGVECINKTLDILHKNISTIPFTATGIPRDDIKTIGNKNQAKQWQMKQALTYEQYLIAENAYHGGYCHANRHLIDLIIKGSIKCKDFSSSFPFVLLAFKFPSERFMPLENKTVEYIIDNAENYAFMFKLILVNVRLKDHLQGMPYLQFSKCIKTINAVTDNGRILYADYAEIYLTEQDLITICEQYKYDKSVCTEVNVSYKDYLPRWLTDYIFSLYRDKTLLKGGDQVLYNIAKAKLNSVYGMCVQKCIKDEIVEDYITGEYSEAQKNPQELYETYVNKKTTLLPYQIGVWVTAYATRNLFILGKCIDYDNGGDWIYSDTDSIYSNLWDEKLVKAYNKRCIDMLKTNNYGAVVFNNRNYYLGIAEDDNEYTEFKVLGAKRYCGRLKSDNKLHITVAGVPKVKGAECLNDDISKFTKGFIFSGTETGKLTHTYIYNEDIIKNSSGDLIGDYIDLTPCDYLLDMVTSVDWDELETEEVEIQVYDELEV